MKQKEIRNVFEDYPQVKDMDIDKFSRFIHECEMKYLYETLCYQFRQLPVNDEVLEFFNKIASDLQSFIIAYNSKCDENTDLDA